MARSTSHFPNKDAILAHLMERDLSAQEEAYRAMIAEMHDEPLEALVAAIVEHATARYVAHPRLIRAVFVHAPRLQQLSTILRIRRSIGAAMAQLIRERPDIHVPDADAERAAFVVLNAVMGVYQTWVLADPEDRMDTEALNAHLGALILGYLAAAADLSSG